MAADGFWVMMGIGFQILLRALTALRMRAIAHAQNLNMSTLTMMRIVFSSTFYSIFAPGSLAGGAVTFVKYLQHGAKPISAMANLYANKFIELLVVTLSAPLFWLMDKGFSFPWVLGYICMMVIGILMAFAIFLGRYGSLQWLATKINSHGQSLMRRKLAAVWIQIRQVGQVSKGILFSLVASYLMNILFVALSILCYAKALSIEVGLLPILWIYAIIFILRILPISISNIGVREASMVVLFAPYGVAATEATAWSLLMYSGLLFCGFIGLLIEAEFFWLRKKPPTKLESKGDPASQVLSQEKKRGGSDEPKSD